MPSRRCMVLAPLPSLLPYSPYPTPSPCLGPFCRAFCFPTLCVDGLLSQAFLIIVESSAGENRRIGGKEEKGWRENCFRVHRSAVLGKDQGWHSGATISFPGRCRSLAMAETKKRKGSICEEDVLLLLNKYSPMAILNLLKEVAQFAGVKIDWNALVKRSSTGISSAREYQMLWRHLAYRDPLLEKLEADAEPLDDDSDLEFELEPFPAVSCETSSEAAACVKILISSGLPNETGSNRPSVEVPSSTNTTNGQMSCTIFDKQLARTNRGATTAIPVSLQKQQQAPAPSAEVLNGNGSANAGGTVKKKRKLWTKEEDMELIAAVDKCGEGNWANILKGDFKHDRTASQLSQRWSIIRKKRANLSVGNGSSPAGSAPTEAHMATWQAVNMAIKMPIVGGLTARRPGSTGTLQSGDATNSSAAAAAAFEATTPSAPEVSNQSCQHNNQATSQKGGTLNPSNNSRPKPKITTIPVKPLGGPSSIIQAAAFAAGGRIAPPSTAASHFKAAQSKNAVHIRPGGSLPSSTMSGSKSLPSMTTSGPPASNVRCIKTSISSKDPVMTSIGPRTTSHQGMPNSSDQLSPSCNATPSSNQPTEQVHIKSLSASTDGEHTTPGLQMEENKAADESKSSSPVSHDQVELLNLDMDSDNAGVDQIDDSKSAADSHLAGEPGIPLNKSGDLASADMDDKAVPAIKADDGVRMEIIPVVQNGEMTENDKGNATNNQMRNADAVAVCTENKTPEQTASRNPVPNDNQNVKD
ncbi:hypothetical protein Taro_037877 [Colocasia esculenta]|uniref:Uncharacterized protein n=1 Tax=Colocasia esculenta TaxID=4460 RepID=A0A843WE53_COLES|nr:hypothetical protein [Colocasia esculenta]